MSDERRTTSEKLGEEFSLPSDRAEMLPSGSAFQCPVCYGIAYNPVCPYCDEEDGANQHGGEA